MVPAHFYMVGARGIEPPASPTPKVRATPALRPDMAKKIQRVGDEALMNILHLVLK